MLEKIEDSVVELVWPTNCHPIFVEAVVVNIFLVLFL